MHLQGGDVGIPAVTLGLEWVGSPDSGADAAG
jgi:hypothetical protein